CVVVCSFSFVVLFSCSGDLRDLHSFPTRRSSDLGGGSALVEALPPSLSLPDLAETTRLLLAAGAPIEEINVLRKHMSRVKGGRLDRKSTRLNSSHVKISYAVFCLKKKKNQINAKR